MYSGREVHADMTVVLLKLLLEVCDLADVRLRGFRPLDHFQLIFTLHRCSVVSYLFLPILQGLLDEGLALVIILSGHAAKIEERQFSQSLGVCDQLPFLGKHTGFVC